MGQSPQPFSRLARLEAAQCRRKIAVGWEQVEAGRRILAHSRWLLQRWAEQACAGANAALLQSVATRRPMGGTFEPVESETPRERLRPGEPARLRQLRIAAAAMRPFRPSHTSAGAP